MLLIDDDERILEVLSAYLSTDGYRIITAFDGASGLRLVEEKMPDLIILDVRLPSIDGLEVCRRIKNAQSTRFLPVILVTGFSEREAKLAGLSAGADDFINKPIDPVELTVRVRALIRNRQLTEAVETQNIELEKRVAERTRELSNALERLQQLSQVRSNVLAIVSHELRTPLHQAKTALELILRPDVNKELHPELLNTLERAFRRLEYRVRDVAVFSAPPEITTVPNSLKGLLDGAVEQTQLLHPTARQRITLTLAENLPPVLVDATSFTRAMGHLIENALKFSDDKKVEIEAAPCPDGVRVSITDQGPGIPEEKRPHLFEPLNHTTMRDNRRHGGMGIGLALTKMIFDAHGIEMTVTSVADEGTSVTFVLKTAPLVGGA